MGGWPNISVLRRKLQGKNGMEKNKVLGKKIVGRKKRRE